MKCKHCGAEIDNDSNFCEFCGRKQEQYEDVLLSIMDGASLNDAPLVAYKARKKCYQLCREKHPYDYKEYVMKIMADDYPQLSERCNIDSKYIRKYVIFSFLFFFCFCVAYSVHWEVYDTCLYMAGEYRIIQEWQLPYDSSGFPLDTIWVNRIVLDNGALHTDRLPYIYWEYLAVFIICSVICIISLIQLLFGKKWYRKQKLKLLNI